MWNLWHGCHKLSEGCRHCYVYRTDGKYGKDSSVVTKTEKFDLPLQRKKNGTYKIPSGNLVYTCFTSDFLIEDADEWRAEAWEMMRIRHFYKVSAKLNNVLIEQRFFYFLQKTIWIDFDCANSNSLLISKYYRQIPL